MASDTPPPPAWAKGSSPARRQAGAIRDLVIAHVAVEIRAASDPATAERLRLALGEVLARRLDPGWWIDHRVTGVIGVVQAGAHRVRVDR